MRDTTPITSINPADNRTLRVYPEMDRAAVGELLTRNQAAYEEWKKRPVSDRAPAVRRTAERLRAQAVSLAELAAREMGKPVSQGRAEVEKCAWVCEYYADGAEAFLAPEVVESTASRSYVHYAPQGSVLAIMPWNFPFWQVFRHVAPNLMAGNGCLLKHAENVGGCAVAIEEILQEAGVPRDLFRTLLIPKERSEEVIRHPQVRAVTLTGSTAAGKAVAQLAGRYLKKSVLELGGSDAYLVLEDADLERAASTCAASRMINGGQSCIAAKRFIVAASRVGAFTDALVECMKKYSMDDPLLESTNLGPMARVDLRDKVHQQVSETVARGARLVLGGEVPSRPGAWYPPTVLSDVPLRTPGADQEIFGPVACVLPAASEQEAVRIANDTPYGLGAAVFTRDVERGERLARDGLDAGNCFVNAFVQSDPRLPFGGVKASGYGRELSHFGIREFTNVKTVYLGDG